MYQAVRNLGKKTKNRLQSEMKSQHSGQFVSRIHTRLPRRSKKKRDGFTLSIDLVGLLLFTDSEGHLANDPIGCDFSVFHVDFGVLDVD